MIRRGFLLVVVWVALAPACRGAEPPVPPIHPQGFEALRYLLQSFGLQPLEQAKDLFQNPNEALLVVLGDANLSDVSAPALRSFLDGGGAVLLATNQPTRGVWAEALGVRIEERVRTKVPLLEGYDEQPDSPMIDRFVRKPFRNLKCVVAQRPAAVRMEPLAEQVRSVAWFPEGCAPEGRLVFAMSREDGASRSLVLGSHEVFANHLLLQRDVENFEFAYLGLQWLHDRRRQKVLLYEDGRIVRSLDLTAAGSWPALPAPQPPVPTVQAINNLIRHAQEEDLFNHILFHDVSQRQIARTLILVLSVFLIVLLLRRVWQAKHRGTVDLAKAADSAVPVRLESAMLQRKYREMLKNNVTF